jgi:LCP family protein required for cell wall assembly
MSEPSRHPGRPRLHALFLGVAASVASLVLVTSAFAMGAYVWTKGQIRTIPDAPGAPADAPDEPDIAGRCAVRQCNYLLLGSDSREGLTPEEIAAFGSDEFIGGENRSDTIILVHTRPERKQAIFLSFPRDLWVDIPGVGMNRINAAFEGGIEGGGAQLVSRTVTRLTGMQIHHVMYVSLLGFQKVVDALGGVDMCVPYPMQDPLALLDIPAGCQHFDGRTALAYVRTRHQVCDTIPDFARISRQQQFLRALLAKLLQPAELLRLPDLVPQVLDNLVVDEGLNPAELVYLAGRLQGVGTEDADFRAVPTIPEGIYDADGRYVSVVKAIEPDAQDLFRRLREGRPLGDLGTQLAQTPPSPANVVVSVVDRRADSAAGEVLSVLTEGGFNTSPGIVDAGSVSLPKTGPMILYRDGAEPMAKVVGTYLYDLELVPAPAGTLGAGENVAVVVTDGYVPPPPKDEPPVDCPT